MYSLSRCIEQATSDSTARQFLHGKDDKYSPERSPAAKAALSSLEKTGCGQADWKVLADGSYGKVWANQDKVFKLHRSDEMQPRTNVDEDIIRDFGAKTLLSGTCNGVSYHLDERLNTQEHVHLAQIIPYLFQLYERGYVYEESSTANFGYNKNGDLRALDHKYFAKSRGRKHFAETLGNAIKYLKQEPFPVITCDDTAEKPNTYLILEPSMGETEFAAQKKKLKAALKTVGIEEENITIIASLPPVFKIDRTEVNYGTPPEPHPLEDFIDNALKATIRDMKPNTRVMYFLDKLRNALAEYPSLQDSLPRAEVMGGFDAASFDAWSKKLRDGMDDKSFAVDAVSRIIGSYVRETYRNVKRAG